MCPAITGNSNCSLLRQHRAEYATHLSPSLFVHVAVVLHRSLCSVATRKKLHSEAELGSRNDRVHVVTRSIVDKAVPCFFDVVARAIRVCIHACNGTEVACKPVNHGSADVFLCVGRKWKGAGGGIAIRGH